MSERVASVRKKAGKQSVAAAGKTPRRSFAGYPAGSTFDVPSLQRTLGNQAVGRLILQSKVKSQESGVTKQQSGVGSRESAVRSQESGAIQPKLSINRPNDVHEQEADRVAEQVIRMPETTPGRQSRAKAKEAVGPQRQTTSHDVPISEAPPIVHEALSTPGQPLDTQTRAIFEPRFGHDFSQVKVHTDAKANESAKAVSAKAYTVGGHIAFAKDHYQPTTQQGRELLAHELTHVTQQDVTRELQLSRAISIDNPEECIDALETHEIESATTRARKMINSAIGSLSPYTRSINKVKKALQTHFKINQQIMDVIGDVDTKLYLLNKLETIQRNFQTIGDAFNETIPFECGGLLCDASTEGYSFPWMDIHICPRWWLYLGSIERAVTIIHEMAHKYGWIFGEVYENNAEYGKLSIEDAVGNADSYACFARDVS